MMAYFPLNIWQYVDIGTTVRRNKDSSVVFFLYATENVP